MTRNPGAFVKRPIPLRACAFVFACWVGACGEAPCPAGSVALEGRCEPASSGCRPGETVDGGVCVDDSGSLSRDAEVADAGEHAVLGDAAPESAARDSGVDAASPNDLCQSLACGDHGACEVVAGDAACACRDGFAGDACDACEPGLVLEHGACISPCAASGAPSCNERGVCEVSNGEATCSCESPYTGEACDECIDGFVLKPDGSCAPGCGDCGPDAYCDEANGACVQRCGDGVLDLDFGEQCDPGRDVHGCTACRLADSYVSCANDAVGDVTIDGICYSFGDGMGGVAPPMVLPECNADESCAAVPGAPWETFCASGRCFLACATAADCPPDFQCWRGTYCWQY